MKKQLMAGAWKIARNAQKKFGGKVSEYFAQSLKRAWMLYKQAEKQLDKIKDSADFIIDNYNRVAILKNNRGFAIELIDKEEFFGMMNAFNAAGMHKKLVEVKDAMHRDCK